MTDSDCGIRERQRWLGDTHDIQIKIERLFEQVELCGANGELEYLPELADRAGSTIRVIYRIATAEDCIGKYPANWKESVKLRFAPRWFKRRWPVKYTHVIARTRYPTIPLGGVEHRGYTTIRYRDEE